ncbi:type II secretion system F family protein [Nocardia zapadnayensis]|uniref:type II secretion system F family protein n=1 Tax=Nocardia rhamnosiphila TaxID=426716 RepID=UPI002246B993|nr:type II secretion system F family protein [Nocardia zapadnayensis]MCX0270017.1 type II secretion system F family protein [Nocardia zapadnayensis]
MAIHGWPFILLSAAILLVPAPASAVARLSPGTALRRVRSRKPVAAADPVAIATLFDLLAACLRAGLPTAAALRAVAPAAADSLADRLQRVADLLALGADPAVAWAPTESGGGPSAPEFDALARLARRSARSGSSLAAAIGELAEERRTQVEEAATARAERAGVLIGGPLGLCFLPAFICLGIVPVIVGLAGGVLGGGLL